MAARKKVTPVVENKPKRFEVGYKFPILVEITDIDFNEQETGMRYLLHINCFGSESRNGWIDEEWFTRQDLIELESVANPLVVKEELQRKLEEAQKVVKDLSEQLAKM